jgi:hypothetical protein
MVLSLFFFLLVVVLFCFVLFFLSSSLPERGHPSASIPLGEIRSPVRREEENNKTSVQVDERIRDLDLNYLTIYL